MVLTRPNKAPRTTGRWNIGKLRSLLDTLGENEVSNKTGSWILSLNLKQIYVDYYDYLSLSAKGKLIYPGRHSEIIAAVQTRQLPV